MRNATDAEDGFLRGTRMLIHDRDPLFSHDVRDTLVAGGVTPVRLPARSPNLNAFAERFVRTIKESCLERLILIGEGSLRRAVREFVEHYHHERNHQGLGNRLILPPATAASTSCSRILMPGSRPTPTSARTRARCAAGAHRVKRSTMECVLRRRR